MLNRNKCITVLMLHNRLYQNPFGELPKELINRIINTGVNPDPNSDIATLLHHVAYGEEAEAESWLKTKPQLLREASNVITPAGLEVMRVTPYECALGAGDPEMAAMMLPYFSLIPNGEKERKEQYKKYRPHIETILNQQPYHLQWLVNIIKQSSEADVTAALNKNMEHKSPLRDALIQFRQDFTPGKLLQPGMHFNYQDLAHAYAIYDKEFNLSLDDNNHSKCHLFCRQVLGYEMRNLPARDRQLFAQSLSDVMENKVKPVRSCELRYNKNQFFPITADDSALENLGFDYFISSAGGISTLPIKISCASTFQILCRVKTSSLKNVGNNASETKQACMIL